MGLFPQPVHFHKLAAFQVEQLKTGSYCRLTGCVDKPVDVLFDNYQVLVFIPTAKRFRLFMVTMNLPGRQKFPGYKAASILAHEQGDAVIIVFHATSLYRMGQEVAQSFR